MAKQQELDGPLLWAEKNDDMELCFEFAITILV